MATKFDPYQAWLGIPAGVRPPNHYQLLGLELFESEPPVIAEAAEERAERVRASAVGPQADLGRQLLAELVAARKVLLSATTRRAYDADLRQKLGMPPAPQPKTAAAPVPRVAPTRAAAPVAATPVAGKPAAQAVASKAAVPVAAVPLASFAAPTVAQSAVPPSAVPLPAVAQAVPVAGGYMPTAVGRAVATPVTAGASQASAVTMPDLALDDVTSESTYRPRYRRKTSAGSWALLAIGFLVLAGLGAVCFVYKDRLLAALEDRPETTEVVGANTPTRDSPTTPEATTHAMSPATAAARAGGARNNGSQPGTRDMAGIDLSSPTLVNRGPPPTTQRHATNPNMQMDGNRGGGRKTPLQAKPKPVAPKVVIPSLNKPASAEEKAAVAKSLAAVRKALGERNTVKAAEQMNLATLEASSPDSLAAIDRMKTLESALDVFWKAVHAGLKSLKPVDGLNYDGLSAVVINVEDDSLSIRVEGQSKEYKVDKLPTGLAYYLAELSLREGDPQTKVLLGAFLYVEPKGDHQKARQLWEDAASQGADVAKLLVQLDLDLAGETGK